MKIKRASVVTAFLQGVLGSSLNWEKPANRSLLLHSVLVQSTLQIATSEMQQQSRPPPHALLPQSDLTSSAASKPISSPRKIIYYPRRTSRF